MQTSPSDPAPTATVTAAAPRYDRVTILFHWLTAALVVALWGIAQVIDVFPKGSPRIAARSTHILLGALLGIVLLARIGWRITAGERLPPADRGALGLAARIVHYALYLSLVATVTLGLANASARADQLFEWFTIPKLAPGISELKKTIEELHGSFANVILILAGLHTLAALVHRYVLRDDVLPRMLGARSNRR